MPHLSRHAPQRLDADTPAPLVRPDTARELLNVRVSPEGRVVVSGTVPVTGGPLADESVVVGQDYDHETGYAYALRYHADGAHSLWQTDPVSNTETLVLQWKGLNPPAPAARHADGLPRAADLQAFDGRVFFLDADGEARDLDVAAALAGTFTPDLLLTAPERTYLLPSPPLLAPVLEQIKDNAFPTSGQSTAPISTSAWQAALLYQYANGKRTPLSPYSPVAEPRTLYQFSALGTDEYVAEPDDVNALRVTLPAVPPSGVELVEVYVRADDDAGWALAANVRPDAVGVWPTSVVFAAQRGSAALATTEAVKPFEALWPARALTLAANRVLTAGSTEGYQPEASALTLALVPSLDGVLITDVLITDNGFAWRVLTGAYPDADSTYVRLQPAPFDDPTFEEGESGFDYVSYPTPLVNESDYTPRTYADVVAMGITDPPIPDQRVWVLDGRPLRTVRRGVYYYGLLLRDRFGRTSGPALTRALAVDPVAYRDGLFPGNDPYVDNPWLLELAWTLPTDPATATAEIPEWAVTYQLVLGRVGGGAYFRQGYNPALQAETTPDVFDNWTPPSAGSASTSVGLLTVFAQIGDWTTDGFGGYVFSPGDYIRFPDGRAFAITEQRGNRIGFRLSVADAVGIQTVGVIEIYTPDAAATQENLLVYEASPAYLIERDGEVRTYSVTSGRLAGDAIVSFTPYVADPERYYVLEQPAPRARASKAWLALTRQRPTLSLPRAQQYRYRPSVVRFSAPRIQGTRVDGTSSWDALNEKEAPRELGAIVGLRVVDDEVQATGSVLGVIAANGSGSFYLGRVQLRDTGATTLNVEAEQVLGSFNSWRGGFGCRHPHTIHGAYGRLYWYCEPKDELVRYAQNGVTPLALTYRYRTVLRAYGEALRAPGASAAHGGAGGYDGFALESLTLLPAVTDEESGTVTPALLLAFSDRQEGFVGPYSFVPEALVGLPGGLLSATAGQLHRHHQGAPATFYGVAYPAVCRFVAPTSQAATPVLWQALVVESNGPWLPTRLSNERGQVSQVLRGWLKPDRDLWTCALRGDAGPTNSTARLLHGPRLRSLTLDVTLTLAPDEMSAADRLDTISVKGAFDTTPLAY